MTNWIIIIISALIAGFTVYKEVVRPNRVRLGLRIAAVLVAVAALACLILPVSYKRDIKANSDDVILLTPGIHENEYVISDQSKNYTLDEGIAKSEKWVKLIANPTQMLAENPGKPTIIIYGYGLSANNLKQLGENKIELPSAATKFPDGVTAINWTQNINAAQPFQVHGRVRNTGKPFRLILKGLNTALDSAKVSTETSASFSFSSLPKHTGKVVYNLVGIRDKDTIFNEQLPAVIQPSQPLKILMLSAAPDFENKFLRTWLGNNNYAVASRAFITKGKIGQDYFNMERTDLSNITPNLLAKFDIVEADLSAIKTLTPAESTALQQEISGKGLGLIVRADTVDEKSSSWVQNSFKVIKSAKQSATELLINGKTTAKYTIDPQFIATQNNIQPLVTDTHGDLIAAATLSGSGKVAFSTINNSYSWTLAGNHDDYAAFWSALIDKVARKAKAENSWSVNTQFAEPGEPVSLSYHTAELNGQIHINQAVIAPAQNPGIPFEWSFTYWPQQAGWQQAVAGNSAPYWWFVWPKGSWAALHAAENSRLTALYASQSAGYASTGEIKLQKVDVEISKFYFYILLLVSVTFLWAESKYRSQTN